MFNYIKTHNLQNLKVFHDSKTIVGSVNIHFETYKVLLTVPEELTVAQL